MSLHFVPPPLFQISLATSTRPQTRYRCSRCGKKGHNIRNCPSAPATAQWYRQRCSHCGRPGHNLRGCPQRLQETCRVCGGTQRLVCTQCAGKGVWGEGFGVVREGDGKNGIEGGEGLLTPEQNRLAEIARSRARFFVDGEGPSGLIREGGSGEGRTRCKRCLGRGYLSCMACCE